MRLKSWWAQSCLLSLSIILLAGCGEAEVAAPTVPTTATIAAAEVALTAVPTQVATSVAPTAAPIVATVAVIEDTSADWVNVASVEGDLYIRGNPNAPLRLLDYSDFL